MYGAGRLRAGIMTNDIDQDDEQELTPDQQVGEGERRGVTRRLRAYFVTGLVIAIPVGVTLYLAWTFVAFVDSTVMPLVPARYNPGTYLPYSIPGLGLLILVASVTALGALAANLFGRKLIDYGELLLHRMPVVRNIYMALKQIMETVVAQSDSTFQEVCLIEYPRIGIHSIAFVTTRARGEVQNVTEDELVSVFLPTTPNPTSGYLLFLPRKDIHVLDMTIEEGAKLVISAGLVAPDADGEVVTKFQMRDSRAKRFLRRAQKAAAGGKVGP